MPGHITGLPTQEEKLLENKTHNQRVSYFHEPEVQVQRQRMEPMSSEGDSQELSLQEEGSK